MSHINPIWFKVWRDLFENKVRTVLVVLAMTVGISAFGSLFTTQEVLLSDMTLQYRSIQPSTITFGGTSLSQDIVNWFNHEPEVIQSQGKVVTSQKIVHNGKTYNIDLIAYNNFVNNQINKVTVESQIRPLTTKYDIALERAVVKYLGLKLGDIVVIEKQDGGRVSMVLTTIVWDLNAVPANLYPQLSGYISTITLPIIDVSSDYNQIDILTTFNFTKKKELETLAIRWKKELNDRGISLNWYSVRDLYKHWGEDNVKVFSTIMIVVGAFSLILSGFLVINTISAVINQQRRQIGILKAIGAQNNQISSFFIIMVLVYGFLSLLLALPLTYGLGLIFTQVINQFLNLNTINFHLTYRVLILMTVSSLITPIIAGLMPIYSGSKFPVVAALNNWDTAHINKNLINRFIESFNFFSHITTLSLRNTFQKQGRLWLTVGTLTVAGTLFMSVINVRSSLRQELYSILKMFQYDIEFYLDTDYDVSHIKNKLSILSNIIDQVETKSMVSMTYLLKDGLKGENLTFNGVAYDSKMMNPTLLSGRWLRKSDRQQIVVSSPIARVNKDIQVGRLITLEYKNRKYQFEVVGITSMVGDKIIFANFDYLNEVVGKNNVASVIDVTVNLAAKKDIDQAIDVIKDRLKKSNINVVQFMATETIISTNEGQFDFIITFLLATAIMVAVVGGLGLAGTMGLNIMERTREIGVLRSIGATNSTLRRLVITEGLFISIFSFLISLPLMIPGSWGFAYILGNAFFERPMSLAINPLGATIWFVIIVIIAIIASVIPANNAARISIRETLAYE